MSLNSRRANNNKFFFQKTIGFALGSYFSRQVSLLSLRLFKNTNVVIKTNDKLYTSFVAVCVFRYTITRLRAFVYISDTASLYILYIN